MTDEDKIKIAGFDALLEAILELKACEASLDALVEADPDIENEVTEQAWDAFWWALSDLFEEAGHHIWLLNGGDQGEHRRVIEAMRERMPTTPSA